MAKRKSSQSEALQPRTEKELLEASYHVAYEADMLRDCADYLEKSDRSDKFIWNTVLESFLIHTRNLNYFLWVDTPDKEDDVIAGHFFDDPELWRKARPNKTELLRDTQERVGKYVAHLTYARKVNPEERLWKYGQIFHDIAVVIQKFINEVPANRLHPNLLRFRQNVPQVDITAQGHT